MSTPWPTLAHSYYHLPPPPHFKPSHSFIRIWLLHSHIYESKGNKTLALEVRLTFAAVNLSWNIIIKHGTRTEIKLFRKDRRHNFYFLPNLFCNLNNSVHIVIIFYDGWYTVCKIFLSFFSRLQCECINSMRSFFCIWVEVRVISWIALK